MLTTVNFRKNDKKNLDYTYHFSRSSLLLFSKEASWTSNVLCLVYYGLDQIYPGPH